MLGKKRADRYDSWADAIADMKAVLKTGKARIAGTGAAKAGPNDEAGNDKPRSEKKPGKKKGRKRQAKQQGVSREDVERIAHEMYGRKYFVRKVILYALSAIIPIALIGGLVFWYGNKSKKIREIENLYSRAEQMHADVDRERNYDTVIDKYEQIRKRVSPGTDMYVRCESRIHELKMARVMYTLKEQSRALVRRNQCAAAIRLYETYNGPFAGETANARKREASRLRASCR